MLVNTNATLLNFLPNTTRSPAKELRKTLDPLAIRSWLQYSIQTCCGLDAASDVIAETAVEQVVAKVVSNMAVHD